ncbi:CubicO group peptidase (beta-lactamase class C family) [Actinoplanes octamycinicus]|uniref:CubicO group peptidase (Beta-lactamase class C family) n=1 Tax=Actinoplanes octamycinicus TaxID=135948 RepID=A0A7W7H275_9ACTN|nr:CubicO group peptidase (beta-lactamase class C family) [Actinoplanes octamycinicus]
MQVAVYRDGAPIVDAVAGPVTSGTPIFSFSTGKNVTATLAHLLVARGYLDYDTRIADLWPEFEARGKGTVTLRHVLTHTAGLPAMPREITPGELADWSRVCAALAAAEPRWRPGTATGYHSYTFGFLVGELARRATGQPIGELLRDWLTVPLGIEGELYFGVPSLSGLARIDPGPSWPAGDNAVLAPWESRPNADFGNDPEILRADIPSVGCVTAHGLAAMFNAVLRWGLVDATVAFEGVDQVFGNPVRMVLGYPLGPIGSAAAFGWPGGGGSYAYADPASRIAFAVTKTRLTPNFDTAFLVDEQIRAADRDRTA